MNGLVRMAMLFAFFNPAAAGVVMAEVPDPSNCECPSTGIWVVGHNGAVGDPVGEYCVTIRDFNNVPIANAPVIVDLSRCDLQLGADQLDPGVEVDCVAQTVSKRTDAYGRACFRVIGKSRPGIECAAAPQAYANIFVVFEGYPDPVFVCGPTAPTFDLVNEPTVGLSGNDGSELLHLFFDCGVYLPRIDYNRDNQITGDDASEWFAVFFGGGSALNSSPAAKCP